MKCLALLMLVGCVDMDPSALDEVYVRGWDARPVQFLIDETMEEECKEAAFIALDWWEMQGVDYLVVSEVDAGHPAVNGLPRIGEIGLTTGKLSPGEGGLTHWARVRDGGMAHADIVIAEGKCAPEIVAHEIGHALGLGAEHRRGTVMAAAVPNAVWHLDADQLEVVR